MLNQNILLYGHEILPPEPVALRAGPLTMLFESDNAFLRYVRLGDHEIVRNIYAVVRDGNWNTIPWRVLNLKIDARADTFDITFDAACDDGAVRYAWKGAISGDAAGRVSFSFDGEALTPFQRNRIGICVLHPILESAGKPCAVEHTAGAVEQTSFPKTIAPWQPLLDVRAITQEIASGVRAEIRFEGDTFETEDQRQYGDASFKTYSTPQELPKPVAVNVGDRVKQTVTISLLNPGQKKVLPVVQGRPAQLAINTTPILPKPALGLQMAKDGQRLTELEADRIRVLRLAHLRAELNFAEDWQAQLRAASEQAGQLHLPLQVALHLGAQPDTELAAFVRELEIVRPRVSLWILHRHGEAVASFETVRIARQHLSAFGANILVAAGASPFFTELNRNRPPADSTALPCWSLTPQVHLTDRLTLIENIADVTEMIETAASFSPQQVVISPITLKRSQAKASVKTAPGELPPTVDARQMSLFAAAWTLAHIARLSRAPHLHSATYYETVGWRGVMEGGNGSPLPSQFHSIPGAVFPLYHVFADVAEFNRVCPTHSSLPLQVEGLTLLDAQNRRRVLVANLLSVPQEVKIKTGTGAGRLRRLNAGNAEEAMRAPEKFRDQPGEPVQAAGGKIELCLEPYEIARLDL